jgi:HflK protein
MDLLLRYLGAVFSLVAESAPYLLAGFVAAGLIRILVPTEKVYRHLGGTGFRSVALASLFGIPLPLCSCSVLPTALSLRKSGASKGATTSFLISTPETGVDSISITWALLDPFLTIFRPIAALITALLTGTLVNRLVKPEDNAAPEPADDCCGCGTMDGRPFRPRGARAVLRESVRWAFGPLLDDLTQWLVLGFLLSGLVAIAVPDGFFRDTVPSGVVAGAIMVVLATPMYICATAATPLAATLIAKGLDPGAVIVFLLVGPATNLATMLVVRRALGVRVLVIYLAGVIGSALVLGAFVSYWYSQSGIEIAGDPAAIAGEGLSLVGVLGAAVLVVLLARSAARTGMLGVWAIRIRKLTAPLGIDPTGRAGRATAVLALALLWLATGLSVVGPGETGWLLRFGRITRTVERPGLVIHLPAPFEDVETLRSDEVRGVALGDVDARDPLPDASDEAEVLSGDENLLRVSWSVWFAAADPFRYQYRVEDPTEIVRTFADASLRVVVARRSAADVLVGHRTELESETMKLLQARLNGIDAGVRIVGVRFVDVHAATEVHAAFRDVASALEDKERNIREAEGDRSAVLASGRADASVEKESAASDAEVTLDDAHGRAGAFLARRAAYAESPALTRLRLAMEKAEEVLAKVRGIFLLGSEIDVDLFNVKTTVFPSVPAGGESK